MTNAAKLYITGIVLAGFGVLADAIQTPQTTEPWTLVYYALLTAIAASLKVQLPGITGTLSVSFVFVLASMAHFSIGPVVAVTMIASIVQSLWHSKRRPSIVQLLFNSGGMILAAAASYRAFHLLPASVSAVLTFCVAGIVFFLINTGLIAIVVSLTERGSPIDTWRKCYFWSFPYHLVGASIAALMSFLERYVDWAASLAVIPIVFVIFRSYRLYLRQLEDEKTHAEEMAALHLRTIEALALAIEAKDQTTGTHLQRVQVYACELAKELGLSKQESLALQAASILHDIGKLAVPDYIISKPGKLTPEEFDKMKVHPVVGAEILERIGFPYPVVPIVRAHHEKWDGSGYPAGLKGEDIPMGARILSVVDCFDALASDRQYRKALPLEEAAQVVEKDSGKAFDPRVARLLVDRYPELEKLACSALPPSRSALSKDLKIERGVAPAAGFEEAATQPVVPGENPGDFLAAIAGAREEAQTLYELTQVLGSSLSLSDTLSMAATRIQHLVPYDSIAVYVIRGSELHPAFVNGDNQKLLSSLRVPIGEGLSGWVAENRKAILNGDPSVESGYLRDAERFSTLRSAIAVPLETCAGVIGALVLYAAEKNAFSRDHLRILLTISSKLSVVVENSLSYQEATTRAATDGLTGLPNASSLFLHLEAEVSRCARMGGAAAVLVCDLDGFKAVNDQFGHLAGNQVLKLVADGFRASCRKYDFVARMGGDEFVAILPGATVQAIEAKKEQLSRMVVECGRAVCHNDLLGVSIGAAQYPADGSGAEELLAAADQSMYRTKNLRKRSRTRDDHSVDLLGLNDKLLATVDGAAPETLLTPDGVRVWS